MKLTSLTKNLAIYPNVHCSDSIYLYGSALAKCLRMRKRSMQMIVIAGLEKCLPAENSLSLQFVYMILRCTQMSGKKMFAVEFVHAWLMYILLRCINYVTNEYISMLNSHIISIFVNNVNVFNEFNNGHNFKFDANGNTVLVHNQYYNDMLLVSY